MAIDNPRAVPTTQFSRIRPGIVRFQSQNRRLGSDVVIPNNREYADPIWRFEMTTVPLYEADLALWQAWFLSLRGFGRRAYLRKFGRSRPITGLLSGWNGVAGVAGISRNGFDATGLPSGQKLTPGDWGVLLETGHRHLFRITDGGTASSGTISNMQVEPRIPTNIFTNNATARFMDADGIFIVDPESIDDAEVDIMSPVSFVAYSVLK
jgi:hypothetical protein